MPRTALVLAFATLALACAKNVEEPALTSSPATAGASAGSEDTAGNGESSSSGGMTTSPMTTMMMTSAADTSGPADGTTGAVGSTGNDTTAQPGCGDGVISAGEQCDGADLQGFDCSSLGLNGGTLSCDPVTCTFDTSMCASSTGGTGG